jgi:hypothetical protein
MASRHLGIGGGHRHIAVDARDGFDEIFVEQGC